MADRRAELEKKRLKLQQLKEEKARRIREKESQESDTKRSSKDLEEVDKILKDIGISLQTNDDIRSAQPKSSLDVNQLSSPLKDPTNQSTAQLASGERKTFSIVNLNQTSIAPKESVTYEKQTQTIGHNTDRGASFDSPFGNQKSKKGGPLDYYVLTYDDIPGEDENDGSYFGTPPQSYNRSSNLPNVEPVRPAQTMQEINKEEEKKPVKKEYTEEEKRHIMMKEEFKKFMDRAVRVTERALYYNEPSDIFIDYTGAREDYESEDKSGNRLVYNRCFYDERWCKGRTITSFDWSTQYPELLVASYNNNEDNPNEPDGVCLIWNMKFKKSTPEYIFHCQSPVMSTCFAKFHPNLILGGTYSGQIVLWDNRSNKRTPVQRSPLSASAHTHPVYCIQVVGTPNSHNVISVSTDGKLCSWSLDMLSQPQDTMELSQQKQSRPVAVSSMSFPLGDYNNFIIGSEEGSVYTACRHGTKAGILDVFDGHQGPVTSVDCHSALSQIDFSHLFLTSSFDWTLKLWSTKESKPLYSFEDNCDYLYDVSWSPIHPALFASVDGIGRIDLWNLNNDTELPTASTIVDGNPALNRIVWNNAGNQVVVGDDVGKIWIYDVGEQLSTPKGDESTRFLHTLQELKNNAEPESTADYGTDTAYSSLSSAASLSAYSSPPIPIR
ncbi:cytoplasmic dynein 1 intermediate chain 2-like isoform X2 [Oppia nitens]|uniref:cytoplasmic dynein 1 intermediate chain 2-like isoform X2 n=1 Tax=Oppia nitens TaxID=1686743 RepID=UPI0023DC0B5B|nr:cytoplasmic dynein 1 intermediate chain 2-like isoform X2 [Oppia nitens]